MTRRLSPALLGIALLASAAVMPLGAQDLLLPDSEKDYEFPSCGTCDACSSSSGVLAGGDNGSTIDVAEGIAGGPALPCADGQTEPLGAAGFMVSPCLAPIEGPGGLEWSVNPSRRTSYYREERIESPPPTAQLQAGYGNNWVGSVPVVSQVAARNMAPALFRQGAGRFRYLDLDTETNAGIPVSPVSHCKGYRKGRFLSSELRLITVCDIGCAMDGQICTRSHSDLYDAQGKRFDFDCFGRPESISSARGGVISFDYSDGGGSCPEILGTLTSVNQTASGGGTPVWSWSYSTDASGARVENVTVRNSSNQIVRNVEFRYRTASGPEPDANEKDLLGVIDEWYDPGSTPARSVKEWVYKYYTSSTYDLSGNRYQIRCVVGPESVARWRVANPGAGDIHLQTAIALEGGYADEKFTYYERTPSPPSPNDNRVKSITLWGGCSSCGGGLSAGVYDYEHFFPIGKLPPGEVEDPTVLYYRVKITKRVSGVVEWTKWIDFNGYSQKLTQAQYEGVDTTATRLRIYHWDYDASGKLLRRYSPEATASYNRATGAWAAGTAGLRTDYAYNASTSSLSSVRIAQGNSSTTTLLREEWYSRHETGTAAEPEAKAFFREWTKEYGDGGSFNQTSWVYDFYPAGLGGNGLNVEVVRETPPVVTQPKNGPPPTFSPPTQNTYFSSDGLVLWTRDPEKTVAYHAYDSGRRLETLRVEAVDTVSPPSVMAGASVPSAFAGDFSSDPAKPGLNLIYTTAYDGLAREVESTGPESEATAGADSEPRYRVYTRLATGEQVTLGYRTTGPVSIAVESPTGRSLAELSAEAPPGQRDLDLSDSWETTWTDIDQARTLGGWTFYSRSESTYNRDSREETRRYKDPAGPEAASNWYVTRSEYNAEGELEYVFDAIGGVESYTYDFLERREARSVGISDGAQPDPSPVDLRLVESTYWDNEEDGAATGDGHMTRRVEHPDGNPVNDRVTDYTHDFRGRLIRQDEPGAVRIESEYTNLDQMKVVRRYDTSGGTPVLRAQREAFFDEGGRVWAENVWGVTDAGVASGYRRAETWYDHEGRVLKTRTGGGETGGNDGSVFSKRSYDALGRESASYLSYDPTELDTDYAVAQSVVGDTVIEQSRQDYDAQGNGIFAKAYERYDTATALGALDAASARVSHVATWYDLGGRATHVVDYGDNGGVEMTARPAGGPPAASSATELVARYEHNTGRLSVEAASPLGGNFTNTGHLHAAIDAKGRRAEIDFDFLGRQIREFEDVADLNRRRDTAYDGAGNVTLRTAHNSTGVQKTEYLHGVMYNVDGSLVSSKSLLYKIKHPNPLTGEPGTTPENLETFGYNRLGERVYKRDQRGTVHAYTPDARGRITKDEVTIVGGGVVGNIRSIRTAFDSLDRPFTVTSWDLTLPRNQVKLEYGKWGELLREWQDHDGLVGPASPKTIIVYFESAASGVVAKVRPQWVIYPSNTLYLWFEYDPATHDHVLSRATGKRFGTATAPGNWILRYTYWGTGRTVKKAYGAAGSQIWQSTFDRFGRTLDLKMGTSTDAEQYNHFVYGHDSNSQLTLRQSLDTNGNQTPRSETYGYDTLARLASWQRGQWNPSTGTIPAPAASQGWTLDRSGNWELQTIQGSPSNTATFNRTNEIASRNGSSSYASYDDPGNMTAKDAGAWQYRYDAWGRLVDILGYGGAYNLGHFEYDGFGRRILKTRYYWSDGREYYYGGSWQVLEEFGSTYGGLGKQYVWGAEYIDELVWMSSGHHFFQDANYNVTTKVAAATGLVASRVVYTPYGVPTQYDATYSYIQSIADDAPLFTGREYQAEAGVYDYRRRFQEPGLGRFVQRDPVGTWGDSSNWGSGYAFVASNPANLRDPFGLRFACETQVGKKRCSKPDGTTITMDVPDDVCSVVIDILYSMHTKAAEIAKKMCAWYKPGSPECDGWNRLSDQLDPKNPQEYKLYICLCRGFTPDQYCSNCDREWDLPLATASWKKKSMAICCTAFTELLTKPIEELLIHELSHGLLGTYDLTTRPHNPYDRWIYAGHPADAYTWELDWRLDGEATLEDYQKDAVSRGATKAPDSPERR